MSFAFCRFAISVAAVIAGCALPARAGVALGRAAIVAIVRDGNGRPVAGARVQAIGPAERDGVTGAAGILTLQALPLGTYTLRVTRSSFEPYDATLRVVASNVPTTLTMRLTSSTFSNPLGGIAASIATGTALGAGSDPFGAHAVATAPGADLVPTAFGAGVGIVLDGAAPEESRVEIDGIPIAGGAQGFNALSFRSALPLSEVEIARGPLAEATTVRNTIGGVVDYRTPAIEDGVSAGIDAGYDSAFGAFQHARYTQTFGNLGLLVDTVTGGGENRSQTLKIRYAFSPDVSLGIASYGSQSDATIGNAGVTSDAPAFAADLRASLGSATLKARFFDSSAHTYADTYIPLEDASVRGLQLGYDLPAGQDLFAFDYDHRVETTVFGDETTAVQTFTAYTARGDFALSRNARFEVADSFEGGTTFGERSDPRLAFVLHPSDRIKLSFAAGSAFATEPADAFATAALADEARSPETSLGLRLRADATLGSGLNLWGSVFETKRFDRPADLPEARTAGIEIGLDRAALPQGFGANAYLDLEQGIAASPGASYFDGVPASKARGAVTYRRAGFTFEFGTTLLGAGSAFGSHAVTLGDVALRIPLFHIADVRLGIENLYGTQTPYTSLAPLFAPREFTLAVGRSP